MPLAVLFHVILRMVEMNTRIKVWKRFLFILTFTDICDEQYDWLSLSQSHYKKNKVILGIICCISRPILKLLLLQIYTGVRDTVNSYSASHDNWCTVTLWNRVITAQSEGMGEVGSARYEPALLPPCPSIRVLGYCNCQEIHSRQQTGLAG